MNNLKDKLALYVQQFNQQDEEICSQAVPNSEAFAFLSRQIPLLECPDADLERTYYFRWWTYRKHFRQTPEGHVVTEFLPDVRWAGPYNTINCPASHHLREGRWLADPDGWMKEYIRFWVDGKGDGLAYSMWLASAVEDYAAVRGEEGFAAECLDGLVKLYRAIEAKHAHPSGLFWQNDDRDGMEYSIGGPGLRPTLNSYLCADAAAISRMAKRAGRADLADEFAKKHEQLRKRMDELLWDGDFYRVIPCEKDEPVALTSRPAVHADHRVRELIGYLPWYFCLPAPGKEFVFEQLMLSDGFFAPWGLTTAEQRHPRFGFHHPHDCLWNGPVWPFATSQVLTAAANVLRHYPPCGFAKQDYWTLLKQYAVSHQMRDELGRRMWIDENMHPYTGKWLAREQLKRNGWKPENGGYERGKDYNHSTFCDLVLSGLFGIGPDGNGGLTADPLLPEGWSWFRVTNLTYAGKQWTVVYDRTGEKYSLGKGLQIFPQ